MVSSWQTLLDKTTGALQQHLRLNARTLQTYAQVREVILEYHRSSLLTSPVAQTPATAAFQSGAQAPMDIGASAAALWKGKGKGNKGGKKRKEERKEDKERERSFRSHRDKETSTGTL